MKNKVLKIVLGIIVIALVVALIVFGITKLLEKKPENSIKSFVEALKNGDFVTAQYYASDETMSALEISEDNENEDLEMMKLYFKCLDVKVVDVTKAKNQAVVKVEITNKDLKTILQNYIQKALEIAMSKLNSNQTEESMETELLEYFKSQFDSEDIENVTTTVDVILNKVDGEWKVVIDENLRDALLPGLTDVSNMYSTAA